MNEPKAKGMGAVRSSATISGVAGGIKSLGQLTQLVKPNFSPASVTSVPNQGSAQTGFRHTTRPAVTTILQMAAGSASYQFPTPYQARPSVQVTMEGPPSAGTPAVYITLIQSGAGLFSGVNVYSTLGTDARFAHVIVTGNPN